MKMWIKKSEYGFSTKLKDSNLDENGNEISMYLGIQFKREQEPKVENCQIEVKDGFFSCYKSKKDNSVKPKFVVMDYEILKGHDKEETPSEVVPEITSEPTSFSANDLTDQDYVDFGNIVEFEE